MVAQSFHAEIRTLGVVVVVGLALGGCAAPARAPAAPEPQPARRSVSAAELDGIVARLKSAPSPPTPTAIEARVWGPKAPDGTLQAWSLHDEDGSVLCQLPCTRWIEPEHRLTLRRSPDGASIALPRELGVPPGHTADILPRTGRGSPFGAFVLGALGANALAFGGILATGYCRESANNASKSATGCAVTIAAAGAGVLALSGAFVWGTWSRRPRVEVRLIEPQLGEAPPGVPGVSPQP